MFVEMRDMMMKWIKHLRQEDTFYVKCLKIMI